VIDATFAMLWGSDGAQNWPPLLNSAGYAAAQHYGLFTTILDWTVNPQTAVHFGTSKLEPKANQPPGAVFWIDAATAEQFGLKVVLPPPFIRRLYLQRGFFSDMREDQVEQLEAACYRIQYPNHPKEGVLAVAEDRSLYEIDILPKDEWFKNIVKWSREKAKTFQGGNFDGVTLSLEFFDKHGAYPGMADIADFGMLFGGDFYEVARNYIDQLALLFYKGGKRCYSPRMMAFLRKHNPEFFKWADCQGFSFPECDGTFLSR